MKFQNLVMVSLVSLVMFSCVKEVSSTETNVVAKSPDNSVIQTAKVEQSATSKTGNFVSGEHETKGIVRIRMKNGKSFVELDKSFKTSTSGPDLVVILHRSDNVIGSTKPPSHALKKGDYVVLSRLKKFNGAQSYAIPNTINVADYKSVVIWCRKFNATFGAAKLSNG
ncbi:DM13 domain-containing protein [Calothrix sp. 336/3]|uniref:DM13 domain-containing protein n=1 Tax=Calothrix sp. 336/3 TaxID=1337936 RepID=UPI0004E3D336|nr:DM13 domain-containing protein [Calothrix sp. 336/3]AKG20026.1 electron transfer protein with DM13 domain protein [Calothrix sp. 336/3]